MRFVISIFLIFSFCFSYSQSKYTAEQAEKSTNPQVIANFIKNNPTDPKTPMLKQKLMALITAPAGSAPSAPSGSSKPPVPKIKPLTPTKLEKEIKKDIATDANSEHTKRTVDLLNHLFNEDPHSKTAYLMIKNNSKCNLVVKISGKKYYNLDVQANNQNYILLDKGKYTFNSTVCGAVYNAVKDVQKDLEIDLNPPVPAGNK